jgi:acylpyruvate hydrolase
MKLATLYRQGGAPALHVAVDEGYVPVDELARAEGAGELDGLADVGALLARGPDALERLRSLDPGRASPVPASGARLAPPLLRPGKIICIGLNYAAHIEESRTKRSERIVLFAKFPSCIIADGEEIVHPEITSQLDYEGELAVIIGTTASRASAERALEHVAGYSIINDVSARDLQSSEPQWIRGKALDTFAPFGPVMLDAAGAPPIEEMGIRTTVNGEVRQDASCKLMLTPVPELIEHISQAITLEPGDVIATGTPAGVGMGFDPPRWLKDGDVVRIEIEPIGTLTNTVRAAGRS